MEFFATIIAQRVQRILVTAACLLAVLGSAASPSPQAASGASLAGVVNSTDGNPVAGAMIALRGEGAHRTATSDFAGKFQIDALAPGEYTISAVARGFAPLTDRTVQIVPNAQTNIALVMSLVQASSVTVLGRVTVNGGATLSTASAPTAEINTREYAAQAVTRVSDTLSSQLSTTVVPVIGGGYNAPAVVALRGPDPSETLVAVDGHQVNNGNTGDYDLSLLDPADLQSVQIVYGIAPSSLVGPDTLGGAINIRTLEPSATSHGLLRLAFGSYGTTGQTIQATGTDDRIGYALSYHRLTSAGEVDNQTVIDDDGDPSVVGNGLDASSTLAKLRYAFDQGTGFVAFTFRDQAAYRDVSATLTSVDGYDATGAPIYDSFAGSAILSHNAGYGVDVQVPLGPTISGGAGTTALFRHLTSVVSQSVEGPAVGTSPYLFSGRDAIDDNTLEITRPLPDGSLSVKFALTTENLNTDYSPNSVDSDSVAHLPLPPQAPRTQLAASAQDDDDDDATIQQIDLGQTERSVGVRYAVDPTSKLHYTLAAYYSNYSTFGHSLDPRFGFVWTPTAQSSMRFSVGSTFQSPQLPSLIVPSPLPPPVGGYVSVGNPKLTAERSTEYDLGYEHLFGSAPRQLHLAFDGYRTDLHNGIATFFPATTCDTEPSIACLSYPVNVDAEVYTGLEFAADQQLGTHTQLHATYGVDSVYTQSFPTSTQDGTIVAYEQELGVPLHKASFEIDEAPSQRFEYYAGMLYEGSYNELNRGPFATLKAGATLHLPNHFDMGVYGTNLTNVYNSKFTITGGGVPYDGLSGPIPTDAYALPGRTVSVVLTKSL